MCTSNRDSRTRARGSIAQRSRRAQGGERRRMGEHGCIGGGRRPCTGERARFKVVRMLGRFPLTRKEGACTLADMLRAPRGVGDDEKVRIPRDLSKSPAAQPAGTWRPYMGGAFLRCPDCGLLSSLRNHEIAPDGAVTPSVVCTRPRCWFHEFIWLKGWGS